jgi:hypothetical protein
VNFRDGKMSSKDVNSAPRHSQYQLFFDSTQEFILEKNLPGVLIVQNCSNSYIICSYMFKEYIQV